MADYLKIPEVARRLDVSEPTVRRMVKSGKLPSVFIGGAYRVSEADLEEFLENAKVDPGKAPRHSPSERSFNDVLEEERRADWSRAVENARQLRESGRIRLEELLAEWQASRERGELRSARRGYLDNIEKLFNKAYGVTHELADILIAEGGLPTEADWDEVRAAGLFYQSLIKMMKDAGFIIRQRASEPPEVEEPDAA